MVYCDPLKFSKLTILLSTDCEYKVTFPMPLSVDPLILPLTFILLVNITLPLTSTSNPWDECGIVVALLSYLSVLIPIVPSEYTLIDDDSQRFPANKCKWPCEPDNNEPIYKSLPAFIK